jgi:hypothetical protein
VNSLVSRRRLGKSLGCVVAGFSGAWRSPVEWVARRLSLASIGLKLVQYTNMIPFMMLFTFFD